MITIDAGIRTHAHKRYKQNNRKHTHTHTHTLATKKMKMNARDQEEVEGGGRQVRDGSCTSMPEKAKEIEEETMMPALAPPSTPLASFMSGALHTEKFSDLKLVPDGSPTHRSKRSVYHSRNRRRNDHSYRRRLAADASLDYTCHCCVRNFSSPSLTAANTSIVSKGVPSIGSSTTCTYCQDGIGMPGADHPEEESPTLRALSKGVDICDDYEEDLAPTTSDDGSCDNSAHVIDRWKNGADSPMAKKRPQFRPARRLPSFDRTPLPASSSSSSCCSSQQPPSSPPRPLAIHRRGNRRHVAFPKEKWHQELPVLNV